MPDVLPAFLVDYFVQRDTERRNAVTKFLGLLTDRERTLIREAAVMGYVQESRAESAVAALRQMAAAHANVIRDGERRSIPATEVVPGDVVLVEEGDTVPADARVIQSTALQTAEAAPGILFGDAPWQS